MGGLSLGFVSAIRGTEVLGLDIDRYAVETYNLNLTKFGCKAVVQDVLEWDPVGEYDIVIGGVPCQPYSLANTKKKGKDHPLYPTLPRFFDVVLELRPKAFLMENVKGLVTRRHRPLLEEQLRRVEPYYNIKYKVLNAAYYGVPQRRERLFVLGIRRDLGVNPSFPNPTHAEEERATLTGRLYKWVTVREAIGDLLLIPPQGLPVTEYVGTSVKINIANPKGFGDTSKVPNKLDLPTKTVMKGGGNGGAIPPLVELPTEHVMTEKGGWTNPKSDWGSRVMPEDKPSYTITEKHRSGQLVKTLIPSEHEVRGYIDPEKQFNWTWVRRHPLIDEEKASPTIVGHIHKNLTRNELAVKDRVGYRRLTVRECLRLQSFPDWWQFPKNVSVSRKYRLVGEAVPPILAYRLAIHIISLLGENPKYPPSKEDFDLPYFERSFPELVSESYHQMNASKS